MASCEAIIATDENDVENHSEDIPVRFETDDDKKHVENRVKDDTVVGRFDPDTGDAVGNEDEAASNEAIEKEIPHDVFSLFYVATDWKPKSVAVFTFVLQMTIFVQILFDLFVTKGSQIENTLHIPPDNTLSVKLSQVIACFVSVITQDDFTSAVDIHNFSSSKWVISNGMRFFEGVLSLVVSFFFIIQSQRSVDIFLNFVAVTFVSKLDDVVFMLAAGNYLGLELKKLTKKVKETSIPTDSHRRFQVPRKVIFLVALLAMWISLGCIQWQQRNNKYMCQSISVQMDDTHNAKIGYYSGVYDLQEGREFGYPYYRDENCTNDTDCGWFSYCKHQDRWIFSIDDFKNCTSSLPEIKSPITASYDILSEPSSDWKTYSGSTSDFQIKCNQCVTDSDCGGDKGTCQNDKTCKCHPGFSGKLCELTEPCTKMVVADPDVTFGPTWAKRYIPLRDDDNKIVEAYGRPVFYNGIEWFDFLFFTGRRWAINSSDDFYKFDGNSTGDFARFFKNEFHGWRTAYYTQFVSEPTNLGYPANIAWHSWLSDAGTGTGNTHGITKGIETKLLCADCGDTNNMCDPDGGTCTSTEGRTRKRCVCNHNYSGVLCQVIDNKPSLSPSSPTHTKYPTRDLY